MIIDIGLNRCVTIANVTVSISALKMPLSQKVNELVLLAKGAKKESEFQQMYKYKKFKEKTVDKKAISEIADLVDELYLLQFYEECIFWGNKFVEDSRVRDSGERLNAFSILFTSYFQTNNFEKAIECGQIVYQYQMNDFKGKESFLDLSLYQIYSLYWVDFL